MLDFLIAYNKGLSILDDYDHQTMDIECSLDTIYRISYEECIHIIHENTFYEKGCLFGLEKMIHLSQKLKTFIRHLVGQTYTLLLKIRLLTFFI